MAKTKKYFNAKQRKLYEIRAKNCYKKANPNVKILMWKFKPEINTIFSHCIPHLQSQHNTFRFEIN